MNTSVTVLLELLTALLDLFNEILQSADFLTIKALISPQNASIIPDSYTYLLCSKLCRHNHRIPTYKKGCLAKRSSYIKCFN